MMQRHKHKCKHKKKEQFPFLVVAFMLALMLALPQFTRCFLVLMFPLMHMLVSYVSTSFNSQNTDGTLT